MSEGTFYNGYNNYGDYTPTQLEGSEFGGVARTRNTVQPKGDEALTAAERLRLGYLTGSTADPLQVTELSLEDKRQMMGLKPSQIDRPVWLSGTGRIPLAEIMGVEYPDELAIEDEAGS